MAIGCQRDVLLHLAGWVLSVIVLHIPSAACSASNLSKAAGDRSGSGWSTVGKETHTLMDWAQSRGKVKDKRIL